MSKYWLVKVVVMFIALVGVVWLMASLEKGRSGQQEIEAAFDTMATGIPAKVITQPPKQESHRPQH